MARRITKDYIEKYDKIVFTQPLAHQKYLKQIYNKYDNGWLISYDSDSVHHVCFFDGVFRDCKECGILEDDFDISYCVSKTESISSAALIERINDCMKAEIEVNFLNEEE
jgi:hypothetical protein